MTDRALALRPLLARAGASRLLVGNHEAEAVASPRRGGMSHRLLASSMLAHDLLSAQG